VPWNSRLNTNLYRTSVEAPLCVLAKGWKVWFSTHVLWINRWDLLLISCSHLYELLINGNDWMFCKYINIYEVRITADYFTPGGVQSIRISMSVSVCMYACLYVCLLTSQQVAQLSLTNTRDALHHDKRQNFKTVTWP